MDKSGIHGIPTMYAGTQYRSRLEARWAAFFRSIGWLPHYEPFDLNGYIPDFLLSSGAPGALVEVKPELNFDALAQHADKILASGWTDDFIIVGARIFSVEYSGEATIGLYYQAQTGLAESWDELGWEQWGRADLHRCTVCGSIMAVHSAGNWKCSANGCRTARRAGHMGAYHASDAELAWRAASNLTQWRGPLNLENGR